MVKERPIPFSTPLMGPLLAGTKTQTRRIVQHQAEVSDIAGGGVEPAVWWPRRSSDGDPRSSPYGMRGDRLWVKETWAVCSDHRETVDEAHALAEAREQMPWASIIYRADANGGYAESHRYSWRSPRFMPRWAARKLTLEITDVRVERLQAITEEDARAEGVEPSMHQETWTAYDPISQSYPSFTAPPDPAKFENIRRHPPEQIASAREQFARLWDAINGKKSPWAANGWVWRLVFRKVDSGGAT